MIEPDTFLYFVDREAIHMWEFDRTKKVLIRKESKEGFWISKGVTTFVYTSFGLGILLTLW